MTGAVHYEPNQGIARLTLDQPLRLNAISLAMWREIPQWVAQAVADPGIRLIVLAGAGERAFSAGADISGFARERNGAMAVKAYDDAVEAAETALEHASKPTIAFIQGICFGGGLGLASACDLRLCNQSARLRIPAALLGIGYAPRGLARLARLVGPSVAAEMFFAAQTYNAQEATAIGLVNRWFPDASFVAQANQYASNISAHAPLTLGAAKATLLELTKPEHARDFAGAEALVRQCYDSADYAEGQRAFAQKRAPAFTGK